MNTTTTKNVNKSGAERWVMLFICVLALYGAWNMLGDRRSDPSWTQQNESSIDVVYDMSQPDDVSRVLEN